MVSAVNLLNKNKKSVPGRICVYVCSTQPRALCLYSFKDINQQQGNAVFKEFGFLWKGKLFSEKFFVNYF